ncbi:carboxypeptidase-like regulatory domain-containing protein [Sphingobacterium olei]|uniref:Carboxypeptidase-like regulatory domain-containing protein n=1 Tax=Sphingobacterium olei TaxID=2571155 RepID=A0A4U0NY88_9SPHI|nr:carboxypeptidase-like regulatory domain-containing protein [Sphingobacterium olei]TJZ59749.1 carboxypeptidase-like regulatory domain-containing protein [Sphingobacterium olei]
MPNNSFRHILILCLTLVLFLTGQAQERKIVQFSGLIRSIGSDLPVAYVSITNISFNNQVFVSNNDGYFSFVAHVGDTIRFSSVGYDPVTFVIPTTDLDRHTAHIKMQSLVIELPAVTPFPWASYEHYVSEFMALNLGDDHIAAARKNLTPEALAALARIVPRSAEEIQSYNSLQRHSIMNNKNINQRFNNPLLNPFAWGELIQQIKRGDWSREKLKY